MPKYRSKYSQEKVVILAELRESAGVTQEQAAQYFGMRDRNTVAAWELGYSSPRKRLRSAFLGYLWDKLELRRNSKRFRQVWNDIMVGEWKWEPLSTDELVQYNLLGYAELITSIKPSVPPFLAPPLPAYKLVGRDELLSDLKKRLFAGGTLAFSALRGLPGVGKTALAVVLAHDPEILAHFHDGVLWASLGRRGDVFASLGVWATALGIPQREVTELSTVDDRVKAIHAFIGMRRMLLVVDDAWQPEDALAFKVGGVNCAHVVTTRLPEVARHFAGQGVIVVPDLNEGDGFALLQRLAPDVIAAEPDAARELVRAMGGLPLGIILIGNHLQQRSGQPRRIKTALDQLRTAEVRLQIPHRQSPLETTPSLPPGAQISLQTIIAISDEALNGPARYALRTLSVFPAKPNTFSEAAAIAVAGAAFEAIGALYDAGLLEINEPGRYTLHQTIADYARQQLTDEAIFVRMVDFFTEFVETHRMDYSQLDQERNNITTALQVAFDYRLYKALVRGANAFYSYLEIRGLNKVADLHLGHAQEAARTLGDSIGLAATLLHLGTIADRFGNLQRAQGCLQESLALAHEINNDQIRCEALLNLGVVAYKAGDVVQAESRWLDGLTIAQKIKATEQMSRIANNLGLLVNTRGDYSKAEEYYLASLAAAKETNHPQLRGIALQNMGILELDRGNYARAKEFFLESLAMVRQVGSYRSICFTLTSLGTTAFYLGEYAQAEAYWQEGLVAAREIDDPANLAAFLGNLGTLEGKRGNFSLAEQNSLVEGLNLARKSGFKQYICYVLESLGSIMLEQGNPARAMEYLLEGLALAREIQDSGLVVSLLGMLGIVAIDLEDHTQAENYLSESLTLAHQINQRLHVGGILKSWGDLYLKQQKLDAASEAFTEALHIAKESDLKELLADILYGVARVAHARGNLTEACQQIQESLTLFEAMGHHQAGKVRAWMISLPCGSQTDTNVPPKD